MYLPLVDFSANTLGVKVLMASDKRNTNTKQLIYGLRFLGLASVLIWIGCFENPFPWHVALALISVAFCSDWVYKASGENDKQAKLLTIGTVGTTLILVLAMQHLKDSTEIIFLLFRAIPLLLLLKLPIFDVPAIATRQNLKDTINLLTSTASGFTARWYIHWPVGILAIAAPLNPQTSLIYLCMGYMINAKGIILSSFLPNFYSMPIADLKKTSTILVQAGLFFCLISACFNIFVCNDWVMLFAWFASLIGFGLESTLALSREKPGLILISTTTVCILAAIFWYSFNMNNTWLITYFAVAEFIVGGLLFLFNRSNASAA